MQLRKFEDIIAAAARIEGSADPVALRALLAEAVAQACSHRDWAAILEVLPASPPDSSLEAELVAQALAQAEAQTEVWGYRVVALHQAGRGSRDAARATLADAQAMLKKAAANVDGYEWGVLAEAFQLALDDREAARECLEAGWAHALASRNVENLGRLAGRWSGVLGAEEGRARLASVAEAAAAWGDAHGLIYWWNALGDHAASRRTQDEVLDATTDFAAALDVARYWTLYDKAAVGRERAFAKAEALARTPQEWLALATTAYGEHDSALARRALDQVALEGAPPELVARVGHAYLAWLGDEAGAARAGAWGVRPHALRERQTRLADATGDAEALFDWLHLRVDASDRASIAQADYGDGADRHAAALARICDVGVVPFALSWHPGEVVELTRWSDGPSVKHLPRAFCCALLLLVGGEDEAANTAVTLVDSAIALGGEVGERCEGFLVWCYETSDPEACEARLFLLALALVAAARTQGDPRVATWIARVRAGSMPALRRAITESQRAKLWCELVARYAPGALSS